MSAEVFGKTDAAGIVYEASFGAAGIQIATGESPDKAYTVGERGGKYAAELLLAALSELGIDVPVESRGQEIQDAIAVVADCTVHPANVDFYIEARELGLSRGDFDG